MNLSAPIQMQDFSRWTHYIHTKKTIDAAAGTWEVQLAPIPDANFFTNPSVITKDNFESAVYRLFRPMDIIVVGMNGFGIQYGMVDNVYKTKQQNGNSVSRMISIRGRDGMKLFTDDGIANAPELATQPAIANFLGKSVTQFLGWIRGLSADGKTNVFAGGTIPLTLISNLCC